MALSQNAISTPMTALDCMHITGLLSRHNVHNCQTKAPLVMSKCDLVLEPININVKSVT